MKRRIQMSRAVKIIAVLLIGLSSGCGNDNNIALPSDVLGYVNIDTFSNDDSSPQVAFDGTNYLVVYEETVSSTNHDIIGALVSPGGVVLDYINIDVSANDDRAPRVAFDGVNYLVVYQRTTGPTNHDIIGKRVSPGGSVLDPSGISIDTSVSDDVAPALTFGGGNYLVVYQETTSTDHDIIGALVNPSGSVVGSPFAIDNSPNDDLAPRVAFDGTKYLVVYQETVTSTNHDIIGALVSTTGVVQLGSPFVIDSTINSNTGLPNDDLSPAVAFDGTNYLVVYEEVFSSTDHDIIGARVDPTGAVLDYVNIDVFANDDRVPNIAFDGTNYLVVYQETFSPTDHDIIGARVDPITGTVLSYIGIDISIFDDLVPAAAFDGTNYLVVYEETTSTDHDIIGARVVP